MNGRSASVTVAPRAPRVLVVEDEPPLRELLVDVVPEMGFETLAVRTGEEAVRAMAVDPREIVLLDLHLPGMGGMDVFAEVRQRWPATQVIVLTAYGDLAATRGAIRLGVADFLTKPFHLNDVEVALDRARQRWAAGAWAPAAEPDVAPVTLADTPSGRRSSRPWGGTAATARRRRRRRWASVGGSCTTG